MAFENFRKQQELRRLINNNNFKGIVSFIQENIDNDDFYFDLIEKKYGITEHEFLEVFNEDGKIVKDNHKSLHCILFTKKLKELIMEIDSNWEQGLSDIEIKYIKYSINNPEIDYAFQNLGIRDYDEILNKYFDGVEIKPIFFDEMHFDLEVLKKIISNPRFQKFFTPLEIEFIEKAPKLDDNIELYLYYPWRDKIPEIFDGKKLTPMYYKHLIIDSILNDELYNNIEKCYKYCDKMELSFIKLVSDNEELKNVCKKYKIDFSNLKEYFEIKNNDLKLTKEAVKKAISNKDYQMLYFVSSPDYIEYELTETEILIIEELKNQKSIKIRNAFLEILKQKEEIQTFNKDELVEFINLLKLLIDALENSNAKELHQFKGDILIQLMNNKNPKRALELINEVYTKNNLPDVGKSYLIFKILHPNYNDFDLDETSNISPVLKNCKNDYERDIIIFSDLLKASFGSNNRVIRDYLLNIKEGNELFLNTDKEKIESLSNEDIMTLKIFLNHLRALYNNTKKGKDNQIIESGNIIIDIENLRNAFQPTERYDLPDRIVRSFGYFAGFKTFNDAWEYLINKVEIADKRNRLHSEQLLINGFKIEKGDFIKGIGDLKYFKTILQNGSVAKEFLAIGAKSDATPLDTDLTRIEDDNKSLESIIKYSRSASFGPIYFILKNNDGITITRDDNNTYEAVSTNLEAFKTGRDGHYGIRTGFAITEVDYIVIDNEHIEELLDEVKHIIVTNGYYIPVIDSKNGKLLFTTNEYDKMKKKISGLKYYTNDDFIFSDNLNVDNSIDEIRNTISENAIDANLKKKKIFDKLREKLAEKGIALKDYFDSDISLGNVQLIDTGSTGRNTQVGLSSDFDFIMRIDSNMKIEELKEIIFKAFNVPRIEDIMKNVRLKGIEIDDFKVDIDISFVSKAETNFYSTDRALKDRLEQIKKQDEKKYLSVIANIILAKKYLKENGVYKPNHSRDNKEGGLGGVGIENWILQHGGSFYDAALSFMEAARGKNFQEFQKQYKIWDYGQNYYTCEFDEFVSSNMTKEGYEKMKTALEKYLKTIKIVDNYENAYDYHLEEDIELTNSNRSL